MAQSILADKSLIFAVKVVELVRLIRSEHKEFDLARQLLRSGTAIGALIREALQAESKADFIHKLSISLKESDETQYWLDVLHQAKLLDEINFKRYKRECSELSRMLTAAIKKAKSNFPKK